MSTILNTTNTTTSVELTDIDFSGSFAELETGKANEKIYQKITGNVDQPTSFRIAIDDVKNVYANTDIQPALYSVQKKGKRLLVSLRATLRKEDATTGTKVDYPIQTNCVMQYPISADVNAEDIYACLCDVFSAIVHGPVAVGGHQYDQLNKLIRGSLEM